MQRDAVSEPRALVVLNVCRDPLVREARTKALNDAGYYTSAAGAPEEAIRLAKALNCAVAIVSDSFGPAERRLIHLWMRETSPTTTVVFLKNSAHADAELLLSTVRAAAAPRTL